MSHEASSIRAVLYALAANFGIALSKGAAALYTGSGAMLAETIHSCADCANQLLLLVGMRQAKREPSEEHPLGYGKSAYFWSFLVALLLFSLGGMFSMYEGLHKLAQPEPVKWPWIAIGVLLVAIVLESLSLAGAVREIRKIAGERNLWQFFRESRNAELITVMGEDVAALAGLAIALAAVGVTFVTGNPTYDAMGSVAIGVLLILVAIALGIEIHALLIGQSAEPAEREKIRAFLAARPEIAQVFRIITLHLGSDLMVAVKARMHEAQSVERLLADVNRCEASLREAFPQARWIFFEPDSVD
jgi:cation diffusion facilitator family transporter